MAAELAALDMWGLFVTYTFGSFILAVAGLALAMFIIMGVLGRISIYSTTWYLVMFVLAMSLGSGYITINLIITILLMIACFFSIKSYIDSK